MLQSTVDRLDGLCSREQVIILTNEVLVESTRQQLPDLPAAGLIGEPFKRDTAPCIGVAASMIAHRDPTATMLVMPADHVIQSTDQFHAAVQCAEALLNEDPLRIITFGIKPSYPAQVFGYIERGNPIEGSSLNSFFVRQFREKPDAQTAQQFIDDGGFYWNSGIFVWRCQTILDALRQFEPEMYQHIEKIGHACGGADFDTVFRSEFQKIKGKSIDFAVMEKYEKVCVIEAPFDWDDVGNWTSLPRLSGSDPNGNTIIGKHLGFDTQDSIIRTDDEHLVVTLGMKNCIVVHTPDATLVADKNDESAVRQIVQKLEELEWDNFL